MDFCEVRLGCACSSRESRGIWRGHWMLEAAVGSLTSACISPAEAEVVAATAVATAAAAVIAAIVVAD